MANQEQIDDRVQEYFECLREEFILTLTTSGIDENKIRLFLMEKGAYCADATLIGHCIKMGSVFKRPDFFDPPEIDN